MTDHSVAAVITAFHPDESLLPVVDGLATQCARVIVVDDGSGAESDETFAQVAVRGAQVIRLAENSGIAAALNAGVRAALDEGFTRVITFDQDSTPVDGFVDTLIRAGADAASRGHEIGPVVPEYFAGVRQVHHELPDGTLIARHAIQSGMLMSDEMLRRVGLFREDLFIDLVDTEFEMRCARAGLATVAAPGLRMGHSLGRQYRRTLFGRPFSAPGIPPVVTLSTPFRYYYRVRNRIVVNREFRRSQVGWVMRDSALELIHFANALALARPRRSLWQLYRRAIRDARRGAMGRMPADAQSLAATITWTAEPVVAPPR